MGLTLLVHALRQLAPGDAGPHGPGTGLHHRVDRPITGSGRRLGSDDSDERPVASRDRDDLPRVDDLLHLGQRGPWRDARHELDELLETGFAGREAVLVETLIEELGVIEQDTDRLQIEVRRNLFKLEKDLPPVDVMFLYQIIDWIGDVADRAQRVGNRLEQLLAR